MRNFFYTLLFLFALLFVQNQVSAQSSDWELFLTTSSEKPQINESFQITLTFKQASSQNQINMQNIPIPGIDAFSLQSSNQSTSVKMINNKSAFVTQITKTLISREQGNYKIGPVQVSLVDPSGKTIPLQSNSLDISVSTIKGSLNNKAGTDSPSNQTKTSSITSLFFDVLLFLLVIGLISFFYLYSGKTKKKLIFNLKKYPFIEKIIKKASSQLKNIKLPGKKMMQPPEIVDTIPKPEIIVPNIEDPEFYKKARQALTMHLSTNLNHKIDNLTTQEILKQLKNQNLVIYNEVKQILESCDAYQYSRKEAKKEEILLMLNKVINS